MICFFVNSLYAVYLSAISVLMPAIGATFGLNSAQQGRLFPANFAGMILSVLLSGALSDRWGRKRVMLGGVFLYAVGLLLFGLAPTFALALLATPLIGAGSGGMVTVSNALVSDIFPERRAVLLNALQIAFGIGAILGPTLAHRAIETGVSWRFLYTTLSLAIFGLFVALLLQKIPSCASSSGSLDWAALRSLLRQPAFGLLCLTQGLYAGAEVGFFLWMPTYFHQMPQGVHWEASVVGIFWAAMIVGRILTGFLLERLPVLTLGLILALSGGTFATLTLLAPSPLLTLAGIFLTGLSFGGIYSAVLTDGGHRFSTRAGTVFGCIAASAGVGMALAPWAIGTVGAGAWGLRWGLALVPMLALGFSVTFAILRRT